MARRQRMNFGQRPLGWEKIGFDVPEVLAEEFQKTREKMPLPSNKIMGTAAVALFVALPAKVQEALFRWAHKFEMDPGKINPQEAVSVLLPMLIMLGKVLPPTENPPGAGPAGGPPSPPRKYVPVPENPRVLRTIMPAVDKGGYTEQVIVDYEIAEPPPAAKNIERRKAAEGG